MTTWSPQDLRWLSSSEHRLKLDQKGRLEGWVYFKALYTDGSLIICPDMQEFSLKKGEACYIEDRFKVRVSPRGDCGFDEHPYTEEIGGRIRAFSTKNDIRLSDLHVYESYPNYLCDAGPVDLNRLSMKGFELETYINYFLIPRLFCHSYFEKFKTWPWGELSHGYIGILEWYARISCATLSDLIDMSHEVIKHVGEKAFYYLVSKKCGGNHKCLCGSGNKLRFCHPDVARGIWQIRRERNRHGLKITDLISLATDGKSA